jgi:hypothetical protein
MNVQETVFTMMRSYPTLYRTRVMALARLFDTHSSSWVNGELIDNEAPRESPHLPYSGNDLEETGDLHKDSSVVFHRLQNAKAQFVFDNASLMSRDTISGFDKHSGVRFAGRHFDDIPADIKPEWLDAAKELAHAICHHKYYPDTTYAADYIQNQAREMELSVKLCQQFLERFKVITPCPYERAARLEAVTREARALGFILVPVESAITESTPSASLP